MTRRGRLGARSQLCRTERNDVALNDFAAMFQVLLGLEHASIAPNDPGGRHVVLSTGQQHFRQAQLPGRLEGQRQKDRPESSVARRWTNAVTDIPAFDTECGRQRMPDVRDANDFQAILHQPERGVRNEAIPDADAPRALFEAHQHRLEIVMVERQYERNGLFAALDELVDQPSIRVAKESVRLDERDTRHRSQRSTAVAGAASFEGGQSRVGGVGQNFSSTAIAPA